jgi:hypothetical protein
LPALRTAHPLPHSPARMTREEVAGQSYLQTAEPRLKSGRPTPARCKNIMHHKRLGVFQI